MKIRRYLALVGLLGFMSVAEATPGLTSAYITDLQTSYNQDQTTETFNMVNFVSCLIKGMGPEKKINQPRYLAFVDENKCFANSSGMTETGGSATPRANYVRSFVKSSINEKNQLILTGLLKATNEDGTVDHYRISATITAGPNVAPPYGIWDMDFCGTLAGQESQPCKHKGFVRVNSKEIKVFDVESNKWRNAGNVLLNSETNGYGITAGGFVRNNKDYEWKINFSFDSGKYLRHIKSYEDGQFQAQLENKSCLSPKINDPDTRFSVWENWLYDINSGDRISYANPGFQIRNSEGYTVGNVNYWGVNFWNEASADDKKDGALLRGPNNTEYVMNKSPGRLEKVTVSASTLGSIDGITFKFNFWGSGSKDNTVLRTVYADDNTSISKLPPANSTEWIAIVGSWDNANERFNINGFQTCNPNCNVVNLPARSVSYSSLTSRAGTLLVDGFGGWIDGASVNYTASFSRWDGTANAQVAKPVSEVALSKESREIVAPPDAVNLFDGKSLVCFGNCYTPNGSGLQETFGTQWPPRSYTAYTWDVAGKAPKASNGALLDFTNKTEYPNAVWTRLYDSTTLSEMACGYWDNTGYVSSGAYCDWEYTQKPNSVFYNWQSSHNDWDQYKYLTPANSSTALKFDPPLLLNYVVPDAEDLPSGVSPGYAGKQVRIESPAAGEMWLPGTCIDRTTRELATCGENTDWVTDLYVPFSQTHGQVTLVDNKSGQPTNTKYLVKWLKRGVVYALKDMSVCEPSINLNSSNSLILPTEADWKNPALTIPWDATASDFESAPSVIDGVLQ